LSVNYIKRAQSKKKPPEAAYAQRSQAMSMMVGARGGRTPEINVTPLIDVLLVLLIILW
jgi:hypothetical protein